MNAPLDLEAIKARAEAAGPSPWVVNGSPHDRHIATIGRHYITSPDRSTRSAHNDTTADFIAHARTDVPALVAEIERSRFEAQSYRDRWIDTQRNAGPYTVTRWADVLNHADPCDCDEDNESAGNACLDNSEWFYALCVESGEWLRVVTKLPRQPPEPDEDSDETPDLFTYVRDLETMNRSLGSAACGPVGPMNEEPF